MLFSKFLQLSTTYHKINAAVGVTGCNHWGFLMLWTCANLFTWMTSPTPLPHPMSLVILLPLFFFFWEGTPGLERFKCSPQIRQFPSSESEIRIHAVCLWNQACSYRPVSIPLSFPMILKASVICLSIYLSEIEECVRWSHCTWCLFSFL